MTYANLYAIFFAFSGTKVPLYSGFDGPDEGADADFFVAEVEFLDGLEECGHLLVFDDGDDARVHLGPSVCTATGFTAVGATALHLLEEGEAVNAQHV